MASGKTEVDDVIDKLDLTKLNEVEEVETENDTENNRENVSSSFSSGDPLTKRSSSTGSRPTSNGDGVAKRNSSGSQNKDSQSKSKSSSERWKVLKEVKVEKLPQRFVCKYVGWKPCTGLWGVRHTRQPVDQLVSDLRKLPQGDDLPLVNVKLSTEGLKATIHVHSSSTRPLSDAGLLPLQFISYAVQDPRYTRIFVFILVREMSSRERKTECHGYLCSSDVVARQMALSMALAFAEFSKKLAGKTHRFQVDLRDTDELETELSTKSPGVTSGTEFDA